MLSNCLKINLSLFEPFLHCSHSTIHICLLYLFHSFVSFLKQLFLCLQLYHFFLLFFVFLLSLSSLLLYLLQSLSNLFFSGLCFFFLMFLPQLLFLFLWFLNLLLKLFSFLIQTPLKFSLLMFQPLQQRNVLLTQLRFNFNNQGRSGPLSWLIHPCVLFLLRS